MGDTEYTRRRRVRPKPTDNEGQAAAPANPGVSQETRPSDVSSPEPLSITESERSVVTPTEEEESLESPSGGEFSTDIHTEEEHEDLPEDRELSPPKPEEPVIEERQTEDIPKDAAIDEASAHLSGENMRNEVEDVTGDVPRGPKSPSVESDTQSNITTSSFSRPLTKNVVPPWERSPSLMSPVLNPPVTAASSSPAPTRPPEMVSQGPVHGRTLAKPPGTEPEVTSETKEKTMTLSSTNSNEQDNSCCTKLAFSVYTKAIEASKKGLQRPSSSLFKAFKGQKVDPKDQSQGGYLYGIDGLPRGDEEATESSDDYMDIELRRESVFRPEIIYLTRAFDQIPPVSADEEEGEVDGEKQKNRQSPVIPVVIETPSTPEVPEESAKKERSRPSSPLAVRFNEVPDVSEPLTQEDEAKLKQQVEDSLKEIDKVRAAFQEARGPQTTFDYHYPDVEPGEPVPDEEGIVAVGEKVRFKEPEVKPEFPNVLDFHENYPVDAAHDIDVRKYGGVVEPSETGRSKAVPLSKEASLEEQPEKLTKPPVARERKTIAQSMIKIKDKINVGIKGMLKPHDAKEKTKEQQGEIVSKEAEKQPERPLTPDAEKVAEVTTPSEPHSPGAEEAKGKPKKFMQMKEQIKGVFKPQEATQPVDVPPGDASKKTETTELSTSPKEKSGFAQMKEQIKGVFKPQETTQPVDVPPGDASKKTEATELSTSPKEKSGFAQMKEQIKGVFKPQETAQPVDVPPGDSSKKIEATELSTSPKEKSGFAQMKEQIKGVFKPHEASQPMDVPPSDTKKGEATDLSTSPKEKSGFAHMKEQIKGVFKPHEPSQPIEIPQGDTAAAKSEETALSTSPKEKSGFVQMKEHIKDVFKPQESKEKKDVSQAVKEDDGTYEIPEAPAEVSTSPKEKSGFAQMKEHIKDVFKTHEFSKERQEVPKDAVYEIPSPPIEPSTSPKTEKKGFAQMKEQIKDVFKPQEPKGEEEITVKVTESDYDVPVVIDAREPPKGHVVKEKKGFSQKLGIQALKERLSFKDHQQKKTAPPYAPPPTVGYFSETSYGTDLDESFPTLERPKRQKPPRPAPPKFPYKRQAVFPYYYRGWNDTGSMSTEDIDDFRESNLGPDATEEPAEFFSEPEDVHETQDPLFSGDGYRRKSVDEHMSRCMGPLPQHPLRPPRNKSVRKGGRIGYPSPTRPFPHELPVLKPGNPELFKPLVSPYPSKPEDKEGVINKLSLSPRLTTKTGHSLSQQIKLSPFATTERPPKNRVIIPPKGEKPKIPPKPKLPKYYPVYILVPGIPLSSQEKQPPPRPPPPAWKFARQEVPTDQSEQSMLSDSAREESVCESGRAETSMSKEESQLVSKEPSVTKEEKPEAPDAAKLKEEEEYQRIIEETLKECSKLKASDTEEVTSDVMTIEEKGDELKVESGVEAPVFEATKDVSAEIVKPMEASEFPPETPAEIAPVNDKPPVPLTRKKSGRVPRPPPRIRRSRSRTVEIGPVTPKPEPPRRRSQSLGDDVAEKLAQRLDPSFQTDPGALYTQVNKPARKKPKKLADSLESIARMQERPLPPPPPPPRSRSRSSTHKPLKRTTGAVEGGSLDRNFRARQDRDAHGYDVPSEIIRVDRSQSQQAMHIMDENANISVQEAIPVKAPVRKKRTQSSQPSLQPREQPVVVVRSSSQPKQTKYSRSTFYCDTENGNLPLTDSGTCLMVKQPGKKKRSWSTGAIDRPDSISPYRSRASWYDDDEGSSGTFGDVDESVLRGKKPHSPLTAQQRKKKTKSDSASKDKRSSKFYFDIQGGEKADSLALSDREEPPELADKAVQTLSESETVDTMDKDDRSEDTDELIVLTNNLRNELKQVLQRRIERQECDSKTESDTFRTASAGPEDDSQKALVKLQPAPQARILHSSTSEISWNETSEPDSGDDLAELEFEDPNEVAARRHKRKAFYVARELMTSEEVFVNALKLLNEDFRNAVRVASEERGSPVIPEEVLNQILGSLPQLQQLNENLLIELKERIERWEDFPKVADVIVKMGPFLKLYSSYIRDFDTITTTFEESCKRFPAFAQVVTEFEKSPQCQMLALKAYMLKPVQRIPQYRLLLQDYLRHLTENSLDYSDTKTALNIVSEVASHANESMKQGDNLSKLVAIQNSIWGRYEIIKPGRVFIKEGELMKLSRSKMQPRRFILFNDSFMYLTPVQYGLYRINHELSLTGMRVNVSHEFQNEFSVISVTRSFTLAARSPQECQEWVTALNKAIEENASKRSSFMNIRLQQMGEDQPSQPCILGRQAPVWIPDARVTMCQVCTSEFTVTFRRHHCRACGKVVCYACSSNKAPLHYLNNRPARVCDECFENLQEEFESITYGGGVRQEFTSETESGENDEGGGGGSGHVMAVAKPGIKGNMKGVGKRMRRYLPKVLKEVCANDQGSTISGYLMRRTGRRCWKRYWFVIKDKVLYTYKASEDVAALESIPLLGFLVETFTEHLDGIDPSILFQLSHANHPPFIFHAESPGSAERWVKAMRDATVLE